MSPALQTAYSLVTSAGVAVSRSKQCLLAKRRPEGYWWADLTADTTLESDYILLQLWMYPPRDGEWDPPTRNLVEKAANSILDRQLPDGGFSTYLKGPSEVSASVKAYVALKLAGIPQSDPRLKRTREEILNLGGIQAANSYVKLNLSLFDLYPRQHTPSVAPEMILLGDFVYEMSSWTRAIVLPLAVVHASNPHRPVPAGFDLSELFLTGVSLGFHRDEKLLSWRNVFLAIDWLLKLWERHGSRAIRRRAVRRIERWLLDHAQYSGGLGAIFPSMMYAIMAYDVMGYPEDHPAREEAVRQFDRLLVDDGKRFFFQPCFSPVWDTAIAAYALGEAGESGSPELTPAAGWLLDKEVRRNGDWSRKRPKLAPSGWYFEFANEFYPDIDDTAMVLLALQHARSERVGDQRAAQERAVNWLLNMQSADGGWAAFDVDNSWGFLSDVPFADHNAMLDPTCPDITGRVLEALAQSGLGGEHAAIHRGVDYLKRTQETDGSWYGRWGVAYIYGTCFALRGLRAAREDDREAYILRAGEWLRSIQNADGGWGESCASYAAGTFAEGPSTASQTAWALLGLMASGDTTSLSVNRGVEYLIHTQTYEGDWREEYSTGTGFPGVFYLNYHLYPHSFPLLALASYFKANSSTRVKKA